MCAEQPRRGQGPNRRPPDTQQSVVDRYPLVEGGVVGAAAFVVGYLVTYVAVVLDAEVISDGVDDLSWEGAGMLFYNAQFVRLDAGGDGTYSSLGQLALFTDADIALDEPLVVDTSVLTAPALFYTLLVAIVLVGAGYVVANQTTTPRSSVADRMTAGMTIVVGYLPLAVVGTFLFEEETTVGAGDAISPDLFAGVVVAGLLFPLVFGAIGGYLSTDR